MIAMHTKCESISLSLCFSFYPTQNSQGKKQRDKAARNLPLAGSGTADISEYIQYH